VTAAGHPENDRAFWYRFDKRITARVMATIAAKRKKN
jgi:hypothetical protein